MGLIENILNFIGMNLLAILAIIGIIWALFHFKVIDKLLLYYERYKRIKNNNNDSYRSRSVKTEAEKTEVLKGGRQ